MATTDKKPLECSRCEASFDTLKELIRHSNTQHKPPKHYNGGNDGGNGGGNDGGNGGGGTAKAGGKRRGRRDWTRRQIATH